MCGILMQTAVSASAKDNVANFPITIHKVEARPRKTFMSTALGITSTVEVYMSMRSKVSDRLMKVTSPLAKKHRFMLRKKQEEIEAEKEMSHLWILANEKNVFSYVGPHIALDGIEAMPQKGDLFPLTLHFERSGTITLSAKVISSDRR